MFRQKICLSVSK